MNKKLFRSFPSLLEGSVCGERVRANTVSVTPDEQQIAVGVQKKDLLMCLRFLRKISQEVVYEVGFFFYFYFLKDE